MADKVLDRSSLERLILTYETIRIRRGLGTAFGRVTPGQRLDALHICIAVTAAGISQDEETRRFWLSRLAPVLAETSELASALGEAYDLTFPPPTIGRTWKVRLTTLVDKPLRRLGSMPTLVMMGLMVLAVGVTLAVLPRNTTPPIVDADAWPETTLTRIGSDLGQPTPTQSALARAYGDALTIAVATLRDHPGSASPKTLARTFAASFRQVGSPAHLLAEMIRRFPLAPDQPVPTTAEGGLAVRHYALVVAERLAPGSGDDMSTLLSDDAANTPPGLSEFLANFESRGLATVPKVSNAVARELSAYRLLPILILLPGLFWVWRARNALPLASALARTREETIARRDARRAAAGSWAEAHVMQIGTAGLPPLPSASLIARRLVGFREPRPGNRLDAARSVRATLQSAGDFVTVMRPRSRAVEFVFLIRRRHRHDHERARALRLVNALGNTGLSVTAYDYSPDPRFLTATGRVGIGKPRSTTTLDLRGLAERHFGAVLVLLTDGDELLEPLTGAPLDYLQRELAAWPRRMILTPTPIGAWGSREYRLAASLDAPVGRATLAGLGDLALVFDLDAPDAKGRRPLAEARKLAAWNDRVACWRKVMTSMLAEESLPVPPPLLVTENIALTSDQKPSPDMVEDLIFSLKLWLGHGYAWFVAAAIHPHMRFDLTLWLGVQLKRKAMPNAEVVPSEAVAVQMPLFSESLLDRLCLLPWFRQGRMPAWLRVAVFENARSHDREAARAAIERLLERTMPGGDDSALLPVWLADWRGQKLAADDTMIGFRAGTPPEVEALRPVPQDFRRWIALAVGRMAVLVVWASVAFWLIPAADAPQPNGAWFPALVFVVTSAGLATLMMFPAVRALPGRAYRWFVRRIRDTRIPVEKASS